MAQANSLLNNTYQALVAISSSSIGGNSASDLPFSSFATSYTNYIQGLQKALGVGGLSKTQPKPCSMLIKKPTLRERKPQGLGLAFMESINFWAAI
ncbi:hypothetical protein ASB1_13630 [Helicobacter heilmannii]|nr:hypothetical protein ASB1_13630 [Helicobacter heilmannii]